MHRFKKLKSAVNPSIFFACFAAKIQKELCSVSPDKIFSPCMSLWIYYCTCYLCIHTGIQWLWMPGCGFDLIYGMVFARTQRSLDIHMPVYMTNSSILVSDCCIIPWQILNLRKMKPPELICKHSTIKSQHFVADVASPYHLEQQEKWVTKDTERALTFHQCRSVILLNKGAKAEDKQQQLVGQRSHHGV